MIMFSGGVVLEVKFFELVEKFGDGKMFRVGFFEGVIYFDG